jgi:hypothetical protein
MVPGVPIGRMLPSSRTAAICRTVHESVLPPIPPRPTPQWASRPDNAAPHPVRPDDRVAVRLQHTAPLKNRDSNVPKDCRYFLVCDDGREPASSTVRRQCEGLLDVSTAYKVPANQHTSPSTLFLTLHVIYSGCCTNADCDVLSLGAVVGSPVARLGEALPDRDFDLRGDDPVEVAASERATIRFSYLY